MISIGERLRSIGDVESITARYNTLTASLERSQWIAPKIIAETNSRDQDQASATYNYYPGQSAEPVKPVIPTAANTTGIDITSIRNEIAAINREIDTTDIDQDFREAA